MITEITFHILGYFPEEMVPSVKIMWCAQPCAKLRARGPYLFDLTEKWYSTQRGEVLTTETYTSKDFFFIYPNNIFFIEL